MKPTTPAQINRTEIDGVPVFWADTPGRLEAFLYFRVGVRDESFATAGITHLIEHLAFSKLPAIKIDHNGQVELGLTTFTASGRPELVAATLADICRSLSELAAGGVELEMLANEVRVLEAEGSLAVPPSVAEALVSRYGLRGLGVAGAEPVFAERFTVEEVAAAAAKFFTRGNAALVLSGPPPEGLRLPLPSGGTVPRPAAREVPRAFPVEYESGGDSLVLSFAIPGEGAPLAGAATVLGKVLGDRVRSSLRRGRGLVYDLDIAYIALTAEQAVAVVTFDLKPANAVVVAREVIAVLGDLRRDGVTPDELADALTPIEEAGLDPQLPLWDANDEAMLRIGAGGSPPHERLLAAMRSVTTRDVAHCLDGFESSLMVGLPEQSLSEDAGREGILYPRPVHHPAALGKGEEYRRSILGAVALQVPRDARLTIGGDGLSMLGDGEVQAYRWEDIAAVAWEPPARNGSAPPACAVFGGDGFIVNLASRWFRGGDRALKSIADRLPARIQYTDTVETTEAS